MNKVQIHVVAESDPLDGRWRWWTCEYSLDGGETWLDGEVQSDGHLIAERTLVDFDGHPVKDPQR